MRLHSEVTQALQNRQAVVALESTVITHGLPRPLNLELARKLEDTVRQAGAVPATIAILRGEVVVGLTPDELEAIATDDTADKASLWNLGALLAQGRSAGTTVASTTFLAHKAGIQVFATGGIGGVHRGHPFDISADLTEVARTPVTVVCAGAKALLDLRLTFERLETLGVPVIGYQTDEIPAFFTRSSGLPADIRVETPQDVVRIVRARRALGLRGGELVCVPPPEAHALPREVAEAAIAEAQRRADAAGVRGPAATPFMLEQIAQITDGASLHANEALLINNARVAAEIARALHAYPEG